MPDRSGPDDPTDRPAAPARAGGPWTWDVPAVPPEQLPLVLHGVQRRLPVGAVVDLTVPWAGPTGRLAVLLTGGGFSVARDPSADRPGRQSVRVVRERTLADTVAPGMRLLICGVNPSMFSADAGVGYARPGNRFWPAALAAGIVTVDRDPVAALGLGLGMTDFAKRATRTAAEVTRSEYEDGFARVDGLVRWLGPGAVCFVGLSGWRTVVDARAVAGLQPTAIGGRPAYVMPSTSGLNARTPLAALAGHLSEAWDIGGQDRPATGV